MVYTWYIHVTTRSHHADLCIYIYLFMAAAAALGGGGGGALQSPEHRLARLARRADEDAEAAPPAHEGRGRQRPAARRAHLRRGPLRDRLRRGPLRDIAPVCIC